jgi:hypothetical protein
MKKKILLAISTMFILTLGIVAFAVNQSNNSTKTAADSCAMKGIHAQTADGQTKTSCCDKEDCCCKNGSCSMKMSGENASANCCCSGGSCPMKNKDAHATSIDAKDEAVAVGESCPKGKHS